MTTAFCFGQSSSQTINLQQGWGMFSTYIQPSQPNISDVMSPIVTQVLMVKDGGGNVYWNQYGVNNIGNMQVGQGYQVKMSTAQNLTITGTQIIPENTPIIIPIGWSMIGYLRSLPSNILSVLNDIVTNVNLVKDKDGNVFWYS